MYGNVSSAGNKMTAADEVSGGLYGGGRFGYSINEKQDSFSFAAAQALTAAGYDGLARVGYDAEFDLAAYSEVSASMAAKEFDREGVRAFVPLDSNGDKIVGYLPELTTVDADGVVSFIVPDGVAANVAKVAYHLQPDEQSRGDFEDRDPSSPISIPEINVELASEAIVAKTRKLKAQWTPEFAQDLNAYHSVDAEAELTSILSEYISMEIDLEILDMLIQDAATIERWSARSNKVWDASLGDWDVPGAGEEGFYHNQGQWFQTLGTKMQKVSNKIHQKTLRGGANFVVVSPEVATILESIPGFAAATDGDKMDFAMGVQKVGSLNSRFKVYKNPYMTENTLLMGYRGSQFLETGAVYAPYVPLMMTPLVYDPNTFTPRKGIMTRYAKKMIRPEFYGKIFISDLGSI
jgi:hypothetical protein